MSVKLFDRVFSLFEPEKKAHRELRVYFRASGSRVGGSRRARAKRGCCFFSLYLQRLFIFFFQSFFFKFSFSLIHVRQIFEYRLFFFLVSFGSLSSSSVCSSGDKRQHPVTHCDERASVTRSRRIERSVCSWLQVYECSETRE